MECLNYALSKMSGNKYLSITLRALRLKKNRGTLTIIVAEKEDIR